MNVRCYRCGWSFSLSREMIVEALTAASQTGARHHDQRCPRCRQTLKISMDQIRRAAPPGWTPPQPGGEEAPQPETEPAPMPADPEPPAEAASAPASQAAEAEKPAKSK